MWVSYVTDTKMLQIGSLIYGITHLQATGQHKNKAGLTPVYYPFASTHMVNTQLLHVPNVHTKYRKYFRGFLNSRLLSFARNPRKLMYREYYHVYSTRIILHNFWEDGSKGKKCCTFCIRIYCSSLQSLFLIQFKCKIIIY